MIIRQIRLNLESRIVGGQCGTGPSITQCTLVQPKNQGSSHYFSKNARPKKTFGRNCWYSIVSSVPKKSEIGNDFGER